MLTIHGKMLVRNFKQAMLDMYGIRLKVHQGFSRGQTADDGATLAASRSDGAGEVTGTISLSADMTVDQAESAVRAAAGFLVQVLDATGANAPNEARLATLGFRTAAPAPAAPLPAVTGAAAGSSGISVTGQKKLATLQAEFTAKFPCLGLMFFPLDEAEKAARGEQMTPLPSDQTVASARTAPGRGDLSIHGNTKVGSLEANFRNDYGLYVQVCYMRDAKPVYTAEGLDDVTLAELDRRARERGRGDFRYPA